MRAKFCASTVCYLIENDKVLFIKFNKKWGLRYCTPGGKMEYGETPTECIIREFKEETGVELLNPTLKGLVYYKGQDEGIIYVYKAKDYKGLLNSSNEGEIEWISINEINKINQFEMNSIFNKYIFKPNIFEAKFLLGENSNVKEYNIRYI